MNMAPPRAKLESGWNGEVARLILDAPKANVLDLAMMGDLSRELEGITRRRALKAVVLEASGPHFSFGASIPEHLPDRIGETLGALGDLMRRMAALPAPTIAAVRGQCLGGALELVLACDLVLAEETAMFALPEIKLGVFPPAAAAVLATRIGAGPAAELILTGTSWSGKEAAAAGLVTRTAPDGGLDGALSEWIEKDFLPRSPAGLHYASVAARRGLHRALEEDLPEMERLYIEELMKEPDATEGIQAFLEKREPSWSREDGAS